MKLIINNILVILMTFMIQSMTYSKEHFAYYHGGPGFNSNPESIILTPHFKKAGLSISFWNEPPVFDKEGGLLNPGKEYQSLLESAEVFLLDQYRVHGKVNIIAHSFAVNIALALAKKRSSLIKTITLIQPALDIHQTDKNILKIAINDLKFSEPSKAMRMQEILEEVKPGFGPKKIEAIQLATHPGLFLNYFSTLEVAYGFLQYFAPPYEISIPAYIEIRKSMPITRPNIQINTPTLIIYGKDDPVVTTNDHNPKIQQIFTNSRIYLFDEVRHYPHIEKTKEILTLIQNYLININ